MSDKSRFTIHADGMVSSANISSEGRITVTLGDRQLAMSPYTLAHFYKAAQVPNNEYGGPPSLTAYHLISVGFTLVNHELTRDEDHQLQRDLETLSNTITATWSTLDAFLLEYTYIRLRNRLYSKEKPVYEQASETASFILGEKIAPDAWRMRVRKFAADAGLPLVEQRKRQPREAANENASL